VCVIEDPGQQVVEVVCDSAGELAEAIQTLGLRLELFLPLEGFPGLPSLAARGGSHACRLDHVGVISRLDQEGTCSAEQPVNPPMASRQNADFPGTRYLIT
jgi:hypothetical protein